MEKRIFPLDALDGFYLDPDNDRCYHISVEGDRLIIDAFDTLSAAYEPVGEVTDNVEIDLKTGRRVRRRGG